MASLDPYQDVEHPQDSTDSKPSRSNNLPGRRKRLLDRSDEIDEGVCNEYGQCTSVPDLVTMASSLDHTPTFCDSMNSDELPDVVSPRADHPDNLPIDCNLFKKGREKSETATSDRGYGILKRNPSTLDKGPEQAPYIRSVSFQDHENGEGDNSNDNEAKSRRRSYKDSGYGSDGSKNNSMGSQNHEGEVFDNHEEHSMKVLQEQMNSSSLSDALPNLSILSSGTPTNSLPSQSSAESGSTVSGHKLQYESPFSDTTREDANMPILSVFGKEESEDNFAGNIPLVSMLSSRDNMKDSLNYIKNGSMPSNVSAGIDSSVCLPTDISGMPDPSYQTPSYDLVFSKYIRGEQPPSTNVESQAPQSSEEAEALPRSPFSMLIQMIQNDKSLLERHLEDPLEFLNLLETYKLSPNSPSPYQTPNQGKPKQQNESTTIDLEYISRCRDSSCTDTKCNRVREAVIGLTQALAGRWSMECNTTLQQVGHALYHHTLSCCQYLYKCGVPMCHLLRSYSSGIEEVSQFLLCQSLPCISLGQRFKDYPARGEFLEFTTPGYTDAVPSPEMILITTFGNYGNVAMFTEEEEKVDSRDLILKRVLKKDRGRSNLMEVYRKLIGCGHQRIVPHMWLYNTADYLYTCTEFMCGGTLEEYQDLHMFLRPDEATFIMQQLLSALTFLHEKQIIYLYWTASNVLFKDTIRNQVYLSNLSMSLIRNDKADVVFHKSTLPACIVPPEIVACDSYIKLEERSDIWGAACLFAEMLTGKQMWHHLRHSSREAIFKAVMSNVDNMMTATKHTVPPQVRNLLMDNCWQHNIENRITVTALQDKLTQLLHHR